MDNGRWFEVVTSARHRAEDRMRDARDALRFARSGDTAALDSLKDLVEGAVAVGEAQSQIQTASHYAQELLYSSTKRHQEQARMVTRLEDRLDGLAAELDAATVDVHRRLKAAADEEA